MIVTFTLFLVAWLGYLAPQVRFDRDLDRFDGPRPVVVPEKTPQEPRQVPVRIVRQPQLQRSESTAVVRPAASVSVTPPQELTPEQPPAPERNGTYGFAVKQFDLLFDVDATDEEFIQLIRRAGCDIVALKVRGQTIEDALLPGRDAIVERVTGPLGSMWVDRYRERHPVSRHFWIHWYDAGSPIVEQVRIVLARQQLSLDDYRIYLVLGDRLSQEIQRELRAEASLRQLEPGDVAYAKVALRQSGGNLFVNVMAIAARQPETLGDNSQDGQDRTQATDSSPALTTVPAVGTDDDAVTRAASDVRADRNSP
jgi:hypothetical protein